MGFTEVLTLIFIALKLTGYINWSWLIVLSPTIIRVIISLGIAAIFFGKR